MFRFIQFFLIHFTPVKKCKVFNFKYQFFFIVRTTKVLISQSVSVLKIREQEHTIITKKNVFHGVTNFWLIHKFFSDRLEKFMSRHTNDIRHHPLQHGWISHYNIWCSSDEGSWIGLKKLIEFFGFAYNDGLPFLPCRKVLLSSLARCTSSKIVPSLGKSLPTSQTVV